MRTLAIGAAALVVMLVIAYVAINRERVTSEAVWRDPSENSFQMKEQAVVPPTETEAIGLVKRVLSARSADELSGIVRLNDLTAAEAFQYLKTIVQKDGPVVRYNWIGNMDCNDIQIEAVDIVYENEATKPRRALLTPDKAGRWQLDVGALATVCSEPWEKVLSESKIQADLRVLLARDNYYNGNFSNENEWVAFGLGHPDSETFMVGYCPRNSELQRVMLSLLKETHLVRAMVRVRKNALPGSRQCEIISVLAQDWILTDSPLEDRRKGDDPASGIGQ